MVIFTQSHCGIEFPRVVCNTADKMTVCQVPTSFDERSGGLNVSSCLMSYSLKHTVHFNRKIHYLRIVKVFILLVLNVK
jgi:hypothetical protein